jgi:hypothetical protein
VKSKRNQYPLTFPPGTSLKVRLQERASQNGRSLNQEMIVRLERSLREDEAPRQHL